MFFGNADIKKAVGKALSEAFKSRSESHCGGNGAHFFVGRSIFAKVFAELIRKAIGGALCFSRCKIKRSYAVESAGILFGKSIPFALYCVDMEQNGRIDLFCRFKRVNKHRNIVSVNRTHVSVAEIFKKRALSIKLVFKIGFKIIQLFGNLFSNARDSVERPFG